MQENGLNIMPAVIEPVETASLALTGAGVRLYDSLLEFVKNTLVEKIHYGTTPGVSKPQLWVGGAQLLAGEAMLAVPEYIETNREVDFERHFYAYEFKAQVVRMDTRQAVAEGRGTCNSDESSFKNADEGFKQHMVMTRAMKRCYVGGVIQALKLSGVFTYGMEDLRPEDMVVKMRRKALGLAQWPPDGADPGKQGLGWNSDRTKAYLRVNCPSLDEETGEVQFDIIDSRAKYTLENWELMVAHLEGIIAGTQQERTMADAGSAPQVTESTPEEPPKSDEVTTLDDTISKAYNLAKQLGIGLGTLAKECHDQFGVASLDVMTAAQWESAVAMLSERLGAPPDKPNEQDDDTGANLPAIVSLIAHEQNLSPAIIEDYLSAAWLKPYDQIGGKLEEQVWRTLKSTREDKDIARQFQQALNAFMSFAFSIEGKCSDFVDALSRIDEDQYPDIFEELGVDTTKVRPAAWVRSIPIEQFPDWMTILQSWHDENADAEVRL